MSLSMIFAKNNNSKRKFQFFFAFFISLFSNFSAQVLNDSQLLKSDNWIYEALETLSLEAKNPIFLDTSPISVGELKFYLSQIESQLDFENLSEGKEKLYLQIKEYLYTTKYLGKNSNLKIFPEDSAAKISISTKINPEVYLRSNKEISPNLNYYYDDWFLSFPAIAGIAENVALEIDLFFGKDYESSINPDSISNIPNSDSEREFEYPVFAYGNVGNNFGNWGFSATVGKEGFAIGDTKLGSIIYNSTFETDAYSVLSAYSSNFKYNLIFSQVDSKKFLYFHNFNIKLFQFIKIGFTEGGLRNGPVELRFLNPTMFVHSFYSANDYQKTEGNKNYCSYMGITLDIFPIKNLRLYALWAQTELQTSSELKNQHAKMVPDGYGLQTGIDFLLPSKTDGFYKFNIEGLYTTPYLYIKQSPEWSMVKLEKKYGQSTDKASWLGTPFGPDTFALSCSFGYEKPQKSAIELQNLFLMKGQIGLNTLLETTTIDGKKYPSYYPITAYELGVSDEKDAISKARHKGLSGTIQYRNDLSLSGEYYFFDFFKVAAEGTYTMIFNNNHEKGNFQQGFELKLVCGFNLF